MKTFHTLWMSAILVPCLAAQQATKKPATPAPQANSGKQHVGPLQPRQAKPRIPKFDTSGRNDWFPKIRRDLGTYYEEEIAIGKFGFENPRDDVHALREFQPNCACAKAVIRLEGRKYEIGADRVLYKLTETDGEELKEPVKHINVEPGEKGEIEVHMKMAGIKGPKEATLICRTSDKKLPVVSLQWRATGATYFLVEPPDIHLNEMSWEDKREFEFRISSPLKDDFNLVSHDELPPALDITYEKTMENGKAVWVVKGTYGPGARERDQGGLIRFETDVDGKTVSARVMAFLKGPLTMKPGGFVSLGLVRKDMGKQVEVTLTPTSDDFDLKVEKLEIDRLRGVKEDQRKFVQFTHEKTGKDIKVVIEIQKGMRPTYLNGILKIHLNHPASKLKELMFNGIVR